MSTSLTPADGGALPERLAQPLKQMGDLLAQPAVKRSLPLLFIVALVGAAALAWMLLVTPPQRILFATLTDSDKASITEALTKASIETHFDNSGALTVAEDDYHKARMLLAAQDLPKAAPGGYAILDQLPMGVSRAVEGERLRQARETELARSIGEIDTVVDARVHLAMPENSVFLRDNAAPSASVMVRLQGGRTLSDAQVRSIVNLVASSVPGMKPESVTIVDQMGALLSKPDDGTGNGAATDARIDFQRRVEDKYRAQLIQLLTPLVGAGNFTTEVQADVDLDESQATRETYDKQGAVRAEQGNWTGAQKDAAPGGIPGALSNTPPPNATATAPTPQGQGNAATAAPGAAQPAGAPGEPVAKASDSYARTYDLGKEVSVTRAAPGAIKRLSVAVLLRDPDGKPRSRVEIQQITQLVQAAVGYNPGRSDQVTVISRKFSPTPAPELEVQGPWYEAGWVPLVARNGTALVIALLVLFFGVRPIARGLARKKEESGARPALPIGGHSGLAAATPGAPAPTVSVDMIDRAGGHSYENRIGLVRDFTRENPARAALAVRDMIQSDKSS